MKDTCDVAIEACGRAKDDLAVLNVNLGRIAGRMAGFASLVENHKTGKTSFIADKIAEARTKAYAAATVGIILGPIGLAISYGIAAGVTEGEIIPKLQEELANFHAELDRFKGEF